jgi:hypothetical protein
MSRLRQPVPKEIQSLSRRVERWRRTRWRRSPMPAPLWEAAIAAARTHGVSAVVRETGIGYESLRQRCETTEPSGQEAGAPAGFVERVPPARVRKRPGNAGPKGELKDDNLKFGSVILWVQAPPGQSLASRPVVRLAVVPAMGRLMRSQANESAAEKQPRNCPFPMLKVSHSRKAASSKALRRANEGPAGSWTVAGSKRITQ